jgi:hypothetical protein
MCWLCVPGCLQVRDRAMLHLTQLKGADGGVEIIQPKLDVNLAAMEASLQTYLNTDDTQQPFDVVSSSALLCSALCGQRPGPLSGERPGPLSGERPGPLSAVHWSVGQLWMAWCWGACQCAASIALGSV